MICIECGIEFIGSSDRKFCSRSCSATHNNRGKQHNPKKKRDTCLQCDIPLLKESQKKFCSIECGFQYNWDHKIKPLVESGKCTTPSTVKKYLFNVRGEQCEECGQLPIWNNKPLTLHIDHIDGNSDNNELDNVRILCPHCHSQTSTYVARNIKNNKRNSYLRRYKNKVLNMPM